MADWSGEPAYRQIARQIRHRIRAGEFKPGEQLPTYPELQSQYRVSITVVRSAIAELRTEGIVTTHQGKGAFVATIPEEEPPSPDFIEMKRLLAGVQETVRQLDERVSQLEAERQTGRRREPAGASPRKPSRQSTP